MAISPLLAALKDVTGAVTDGDNAPGGIVEFSAFLEQVAAAHPRGQLHVVAEHPAVQRDPARNPRITIHVTRPPRSWLDLVEILLAGATRHEVSGGAGDPVEDLSEAIGAFLDGRDEGGRPFVWTKDADPITTQSAVEQGNPSILEPHRTTAELTAAIEALCTRLDTLESAIGELGAWRASAAQLAAAVEVLRERPDTVAPTDPWAPSPPADSLPAAARRDAVLGVDARNEVLKRQSEFWMRQRLALNTGPLYTRGDVSGSLAYGGIVRTPGSGEVKWQAEYTVPDVMRCDLLSAALVLAAMGHPVRLELLRRMLLGASTVGQLQGITGVGTPSQVQHHMRELRSAGLVVSRRRNHYAIPTDRVVPLLLIVALTLDRRVYGSAGPDPIEDEGPTRHSADEDAQHALPATKFWVLDHLALNTGPRYTRGDISGSIAFGGVAQTPKWPQVSWSGQFTVPDVMACDLPAAAVALAALGHPRRLQVLRRLLLGARTVGELQEINGIGSTGQVHHHLRELRAADHVVSAKRNNYLVPGDRIVPHLVTVAAVGRRVFATAGRVPEVDD